jgi:acetyl/propionyl-CoA carboxylase alpha subunit
VKYIVRLGGERVSVTLDERGAHVDGSGVRAHIADVEGTPIKLVTIGNTVHEIAVRRRGSRGEYVLWLDGWRFEVEALDERTRAIRDMSVAAEGAAGPAPLLAPMPGLIVRVLVAEGQEVQQGDPLVVMEAMKMENELRSPSAGRVSRVTVRRGDAIEKGATLVELA